MKTNRVKFLFPLLLLLMLSNCEKETNEPEAYKGEGINIYEVIDTAFTTPQNILNRMGDIENLRLRSKPWLSNNEIDFYDFSTHMIYLKGKEVDEEDFLGEIRSFILTANGERCYMLTIWPMFMCSLPSWPVIGNMPYPNDILYVSVPYMKEETEADPRDNEKIKEALIQNGKYHAGLSLELESVELSGSIVNYKYTLTNNDTHDLLVLDPDEMGNGLFHYYTNGVTLKGDKYYWAENKPMVEPDPWDNWEIGWFTSISSGQTLTREVSLEGFPEIEEGRYQARFNYSSPLNIKREDRWINDHTRIWLGDLEAVKMVDIN